jgi:chromosome segregation ATPase
MKSKNVGLLHDIESVRRDCESASKQIESISRDRDVAQKNLVKQTGMTQKQFNISKLGEQTQRNLEQEIQSFKDEATKMRKLIFSLEKERDYKIGEMSKIEEALMKKDEDVKMKELMIFDSKKKVAELERKLKEQQTMYETVRTDRNLYSKNLVEAQDEIIEMKRKLKIMTHQIEQLKEEIATKENGKYYYLS